MLPMTAHACNPLTGEANVQDHGARAVQNMWKDPVPLPTSKTQTKKI